MLNTCLFHIHTLGLTAELMCISILTYMDPHLSPNRLYCTSLPLWTYSYPTNSVIKQSQYLYQGTILLKALGGGGVGGGEEASVSFEHISSYEFNLHLDPSSGSKSTQKF